MVTTVCHPRQQTVPVSQPERSRTGRCPARDSVRSLAVRHSTAMLMRSC
jgi:hypothetical protein